MLQCSAKLRKAPARGLHAAVALLLGGAVGCDRSHAEVIRTSDPLPLRDVRVLVGNGASRLRLQCEKPLTIHDQSGRLLETVPGKSEITTGPDAAGEPRLGKWGVGESPLILRGEGESPLSFSQEKEGQWSPDLSYPGALRIRRVESGLLEVINEVDLEHYVGCVVANEVWPTFEVEAFRGQAIVSRTFVLYQMARRGDTPYDVLATQGSQVYRGIRDDAVGRKAVEAAEYTRGIVLTFSDGSEDKLFCAYYSAACGGLSQSAKLLGPEGDVPPLRGGVSCDYCKIAPGDTYRWGPVRMSLAELTERLLSRYPELEALGAITAIAATEATGSRIISLRLTSISGGTHEMLAERFRLAVGAQLMRSTDCRIRVSGGEVIFENGKGFGHGLGLCQWGMQGLALDGKPAAEILRFYYPGAKLTRAY